MQEPIAKYFRVGIIHPMAYPSVIKGDGPVIETLQKILEDDYFGAVEVTWMKDPGVRETAAKMLKLAHVEVVFAGQPPLLTQGLDLNALDEAARRKAVDQTKNSIDQACELGANLVAVLSGPDPGEADRSAAVDRLVDSLCELCDYAKAKRPDNPMYVSLETFDRTIDKKCLIGPTDEAVKVAQRVRAKHSNFGLTVDLSHQPMLSESIREMVSKASEYLIHAHMGNCVIDDPANPAYGDLHPAFGCDHGENDVDELAEYLRCLLEVGFFQKQLPTSMPVVSFEVKPLAGESSELVIAGAKRVLTEAWAKV